MRKYKWISAICVYLSIGLQGVAQGANGNAPLTFEPDIFLFNYDPANPSDVLSSGINATDRPGYDNQPFFTKNSETFLYSREDDRAQTDIWEYDIASGEETQITATEKSEYSPTPSPDNQTISMVYERNNSIWQLNRNTPAAPSWSLKTAGVEEPVGFFALNYETDDILFWSRFGYSIALTNANEPSYHFVTGHAVPSTPHLIPGSNLFSFVHRQTNEEVWIKAFDPESKSIRPLTRVVGSNAYYAWAPDRSILQIEGTHLYRWHEEDEGWKEVSDLSEHGIKSAHRIAVSPNGRKVAIVGIPSR